MNDVDDNRSSIIDSFPLSYAQQRLWLMTQLQGKSSIYNLQFAARITGVLSFAALEWSLNQIIRRHEILRTTFSEQLGEPLQVIHSYAEFKLNLINLAELSSKERESTLQEKLSKLSAQIYDLQSGPLLRISLLQMQTQEHVLLINLHHIIADGWSVGIIAKELHVFYSAYQNQLTTPLPELSIQYADYACWQREQIQSDELDRQREYWLVQLADLPSLVLPADYSRLPLENYQGKQLRFQLPASLNKPLAEFCKQNRVTVFITLLAVFQLLLHRLSGQQDIVTGTVVAGRNRSELEELIGFFVNTLVLRSDFSADLSFTKLLAQIKTMALAAYSHQDFPFEKLVEALQPARDMSKHPLFQVLFMLENTAIPTLTLPGLKLEPVAIEMETAKLDLAFSMREDELGLQGIIEYNTSLFETSTIERMAEQFQQLLQNVLLTPEQTIGKIDYLPEAQRQQLLFEWNKTTEPYPYQSGIHQLFEQQVRRTPDAIAVQFEKTTISYLQLNQAANCLAWDLISKNQSLTDQIIAICLPRTPEIITAMLAILKAGAAYLPIDLQYPDEHIQFMLKDANVSQVLTISSCAKKFSSFNGELQFLDKSRNTQPITNPEKEVDSTQLAYILYTSGSTGKPKGVAIEHCNVVALLAAASKDFTHDDLMGVLAATTYSFDASVLETFLPLTRGGRVILVENILKLIELPTTAQVKWVASVPSALRELLNGSAIPASVQTISLIGEPLSSDLVDDIYQQTQVTKVIDLYGPTETTVYSTRIVRTKHQSASIGHPIANTRIYILDNLLQAVAIGVVAELHIAGAGVSRGYLNHHELNAEKFINDPFSYGIKGKLYKTGDLARYLVDGRIELLGRIDDQVKIRGHRIELGEIATVLMQYPSIHDCRVVVKEFDKTGKKLLAYVIVQGQKKNQQKKLLDFLRLKLPEYMLPYAILNLSAFPALANGKLDNAALPLPNISNELTANSIKSPVNKVELHLLKIWESLLEQYDFGTEDNFFVLGGHSLLAVSLIDRVEKVFGIKLPLDSLWFDGGTVTGLAKLIQGQINNDLLPQLVSMKAQGHKPALFCLHIVGGHLFHYDPLCHCDTFQQAIFGVNAQGIYDTQSPQTTIKEIAKHCITAIQQQQAHGPYLLAGYCSGGVIAFEVAQQFAAMGEKTALLALIDSYAPTVKADGFLSILTATMLDRSYLRLLQERIYFYILSTLRLKHRRDLSNIEQAHRWAFWSYKIKSYQGNVHLFRAKGWEQYCSKPGLGWESLTNDNLEIHTLETTHYSIFKPSYVRQLAVKLQGCIDKALVSTQRI